jgi:hypothetical protein
LHVTPVGVSRVLRLAADGAVPRGALHRGRSEEVAGLVLVGWAAGRMEGELLGPESEALEERAYTLPVEHEYEQAHVADVLPRVADSVTGN